jgi:hypothetical protein
LQEGDKLMDEIRLRLVELSGKGYLCSQILLKLGLEAQGREDPALIRAMGGVALGAGTGSGTCGCLEGGACLIALHAAKGTDDEPDSPFLPAMLGDLWAWFEGEVGTQYGGVCCNDILADGTPRQQRCGPIVAETYGKVMEILMQYGFDPTDDRTI